MNDTALNPEILHDIEKITLFLDATQGNHAENGVALLALQHPHLSMVRGEVDAFIVFPHEDNERWNAGWIGGGDFISVWVEDGSTVIDPWLDEKLRQAPNEQTTHMEPMPIIYRARSVDEPIGVLHQKGLPIAPSDGQKKLHADYLEWKVSEEAEKARPTRSRTLLGPKGLKALTPHSRWAQAVVVADHRGIPPTRARSQVDQKASTKPEVSKDERSFEERLEAVTKKRPLSEAEKIREKREAAMEAVASMTKKHPLSAGKVIAAIALGLGSGWAIVSMFG